MTSACPEEGPERPQAAPEGAAPRPAMALLRLAAGYFAVVGFLLLAGRMSGKWSTPLHVAMLLGLPLLLAADRRALLRPSARGSLWGLLEGLLFCLIFIPFFLLVVGLVWRFNSGDVGAEKVTREALLQVAVVAIPEEFFFRAFLQTGLEGVAQRKVNVLGARLGWGWPAAAALFALAHLPASPQPAALLVFFPGLAFGWLWARRKSLVGPVVFHALCNVSLLWVAPGVF